MKVAFLANSSWYLNNFRSSTIEEFSRRYDVTCLYPHVSNAEELNHLNIKQKSFYLNPTSRNFLKEIFSLVSLLFTLVFNRPEILFSFNPKTNLYSLIICWLLRIPCIPNVSGIGAASQLNGAIGFIYKTLLRFFFNRAYYTYFQNIEDYNSYVEMGYIDSRKAEVLPGSGVNLKRFLPKPKQGKFNFFMGSRLISSKGVLEYLYAASQLNEKSDKCHFFIAGIIDNSDRAVDNNKFQELIKINNVTFLGHVLDMPAVLENIDCVILPSYYPEGTPRSLLEGAASGKIIITTDTAGCRDVVVNGHNGYLIKPQSIDDLVIAINQVLELSEEDKKDMKKNSRKLAENCFDENIVISKYLKLANILRLAT